MQGYVLYIMLILAGAGLWQSLERFRVIPASCLVDEDLFGKAKR